MGDVNKELREAAVAWALAKSAVWDLCCDKSYHRKTKRRSKIDRNRTNVDIFYKKIQPLFKTRIKAEERLKKAIRALGVKVSDF